MAISFTFVRPSKYSNGFCQYRGAAGPREPKCGALSFAGGGAKGTG
jgi:hypothetical protein